MTRRRRRPICHFAHCPSRATHSVRVGNDKGWKNRWTLGIEYCDEHALEVGQDLVDHSPGLRVLIEELPAN